jgi:hypothetical protein
MARESESAAQKMYDVFNNVFQSLNGMMERLIAGQKVNFAEFFRGIASQVGSMAIKQGEQAIAGGLMKSLGIGEKANPQLTEAKKTNDQLGKILAAIQSKGMSGGGSPFPGIDSMLAMGGGGVPSTGGSSGSGWMSGVASSLLGAIPGVGPFASLLGGFGGHLALGGNATAGMSYDIGEMGRETFTPSVNGKVTPNNKSGNGGNTLHIDARGANDPAQTEAAIHRAMSAYGPMIAGGAVKNVHETRMRAPLSSR